VEQAVVDYQPSATCTYIAFNKPYNVLSDFTTPRAPEIGALAQFPEKVNPMARLEFGTEGLLLLSDDGRLNRILLNPSYTDERTYLVQVQNIPSQEALEKLQNGVEIEGKVTAPAKVQLLAEDPVVEPQPVPIREGATTCWMRLIMKEGRNRQVRKMTAAVGCPSVRLIRTTIGHLDLKDLDLSIGKWRPLSTEEVLRALS
jgi:23S rRNA pseudouridine2457 synthase